MRSAADNLHPSGRIVRRRREGRTRLTLHCPAAGDHGFYSYSGTSEQKPLERSNSDGFIQPVFIGRRPGAPDAGHSASSAG